MLTFNNGVTLQTFMVPINPNRQVRGDRSFSIILTNQTPGAQLIPPSIATVTITDDTAGLSFSAPAYSKEETGGSVSITVLRSNYTNSTVSVDFATADGTGQAGVNYFSDQRHPYLHSRVRPSRPSPCRSKTMGWWMATTLSCSAWLIRSGNAVLVDPSRRHSDGA